jgi:hypothetical protein
MAMLLSWSGHNETRADAPAPTTTVVANGTGKDEDAALKQAFRNAVQQAVGLIVDAETVVKDDNIIKDQILTASNSFISKYDPVGKPTREDGLVTVTIKAVVENRQLVERLARANVISRQVEGKNVFAQAVTQLENEKDSVAIVRRVFQDFPGSVLKAEPIGELKLLSKTGSDATVGVTVKFSVDMTKYAQWVEASKPLLEKVAVESNPIRFNPNAVKGLRPLTIADYGSTSPNESFAVPTDALKTSFSTDQSEICYFAPAAERVLRFLVFERQGSSKAQLLRFEPPAFAELIRASNAVPVIEVVLCDERGHEVDGQEQVAVFPSQRSTFRTVRATLFWNATLGHFGPALPYDLKDTRWKPDIKDDWQPSDDDFHTVIYLFPYLGNDYACFSAFTSQFTFKIPLDTLASIKKVEAKISSRNNLSSTSFPAPAPVADASRPQSVPIVAASSPTPTDNPPTPARKPVDAGEGFPRSTEKQEFSIGAIKLTMTATSLDGSAVTFTIVVRNFGRDFSPVNQWLSKNQSVFKSGIAALKLDTGNWKQTRITWPPRVDNGVATFDVTLARD